MSIVVPPVWVKIKSIAWNGMSRAKGMREFYLDARRYQSRSTPTSRDALSRIKDRQLECQVTKDYHRIEKGLSFTAPKRPFGADAYQRLVLAMASDSRDESGPHFEYADSALLALELWNEKGEVRDEVSPPASSLPTFNIPRTELEGLYKSRRSIRAFDPDRIVEISDVMKAVELAGTAPSVCNRQSWKAHYFAGSEDVERILKHQSGNRGFGSDAAGVFVITTDIRLFSGSGERNQRWVDGGIFAMSLVGALHGLGIGTCMLNWSKGNSDSARLRAEAEVPNDEDIIVLIAIGYPVNNHRVARSPRRSFDEIFELHN